MRQLGYLFSEYMDKLFDYIDSKTESIFFCMIIVICVLFIYYLTFKN